jgi:hypothetical protein
MLKYFLLLLYLLAPGVCRGTLVVAESGDFLGDSSNPTAYENLGVLSDPIVQISGAIAGDVDKVDAWTFTVPAGVFVTDINIVGSGFDGSLDWLDLYSEVSVNPVVTQGDLFSQPLIAANYALPIAVGAGTYKLTAISEQNAGYLFQLVTSISPSVVVPEPSALAFGGLISALLAAGYLVRRKRPA